MSTTEPDGCGSLAQRGFGTWQRLAQGQFRMYLRAGLPAPARLAFTEPNLAFAALDVSLGRARLRVELDLEFHGDRAQWRAGEPYLLDLVVTDATLIEAAAQWEAEIETYPAR
jgi:hypothetical protein